MMFLKKKRVTSFPSVLGSKLPCFHIVLAGHQPNSMVYIPRLVGFVYPILYIRIYDFLLNVG